MPFVLTASNNKYSTGMEGKKSERSVRAMEIPVPKASS